MRGKREEVFDKVCTQLEKEFGKQDRLLIGLQRHMTQNCKDIQPKPRCSFKIGKILKLHPTQCLSSCSTYCLKSIPPDHNPPAHPVNPCQRSSTHNPLPFLSSDSWLSSTG